VETLARRRFPLRLQDLVWLALFSALHAVSPVRNPAELELLIALAAVQLLTPRLRFFQAPRGAVAAVFLKLLLGWLLIGVTYGIESSYFLILLLPVVSAATTFGPLAAFLFTLLSCLSYLSFLLFLDLNRAILSSSELRELCLRVLFLALTGYLTYELAERNRVEARNAQKTAEQLAAANRSLQAAEAAARRNERLAALGQLTAGLAHELRNPLGTIRSSAELLGRKVPPEDEVGKELSGYIVTEVDRANALVTRFLEFARPVELRREPTELTQLIDRALDLLRRRVPPYPVTFIRNDSPDIPPVPVDAALMERVFVNLIENAAQASPSGAVVTIKTRLAPGNRAEISVIDRGAGIEPVHRESIFNPFFTTKAEGVGLGLAIVSKIVHEHGGAIDVDSEPGQGAIFRVQLPLSAQ
jgi:signal transduction histidine kinase